MNKDQGIYMIKNTVNNKVYIGSSKVIRKRKYQHFNALKNNKHHSYHLQNAYNKYKKEAFIFEKLEYVENVEDLFTREKYWQSIFESYNDKYGYNIVEVNENGSYVYTDAIKKKISRSLRQTLKTKGAPHLRAIDVYKIGSRKMYKFDSIQEAANALELDRSTIESKLNRIAHNDIIFVHEGKKPFKVYLHTLKVNSGFYVENKTKGFYGYNKKTGAIKYFSSKREFLSSVNKKNPRSTDTLVNGKRVYGYVLAYTKEELEQKIKSRTRAKKTTKFKYFVEEENKCTLFFTIPEMLDTYNEFSLTGVNKCLYGSRQSHKGMSIAKIA
jgi:predicted GIY-YIG superfamily endonuclease